LFYEADVRSARAFGHDVAAATRFVRSLEAPNYSIFWVRKGGLMPIEVPGGWRKNFNLVAVPAARIDRIASVPRVIDQL
jgi:hypothetical protein